MIINREKSNSYKIRLKNNKIKCKIIILIEKKWKLNSMNNNNYCKLLYYHNNNYNKNL